jgi:hypothetical protein
MKRFQTIGVSLKSEELSLLNQRLKQSGFNSLGDMVKAFCRGAITNRDLIAPFIEEISTQITNKLRDSLVSNRSRDQIPPEAPIPQV